MDKGASALEAVAAAGAQKATYGGGAGAALGGYLTANDIAMLGGVAIGLAGLAMQAWFHHRKDRRDQREHETRMRDRRARQCGKCAGGDHEAD